MNQVVVLAGGLATRLGARAATTPKVLVEIAGRPFLDRLLERIARSRVDEVVLLAGHLADRVRDHVASITPPVRVRVHDEVASTGGLRGTAGALRAALPLLEDAFVATYGDSLLAVDFAALLDALRARAADGAGGVMAVYRNEDAIEPSNARVEGDRVVAYDKARGPGVRYEHIDYGATALLRTVIEALPADEIIGLDRVQRELAASGRLGAFEARERFHEIGSPAGIAALEAHLLHERGREEAQQSTRDADAPPNGAAS